MKRRYKILLAVPVVLTAAAVGGFYYFESKFFTAPENQLTVIPSTEDFAFEWGSHDTGGRTEPHAYQFVPVSVPGCDEALWMQFDVGTPTSMLYLNQLESLAERGASIDVQVQDGRAWIEDVTFGVGSTAVTASSMRVIRKGPAIDWDDTGRRRLIGTIAINGSSGRQSCLIR